MSSYLEKLEKIEKLLEAALKIEKSNNFKYPELHQQYIHIEDLEWFCSELKSYIYMEPIV